MQRRMAKDKYTSVQLDIVAPTSRPNQTTISGNHNKDNYDYKGKKDSSLKDLKKKLEK